MDQKEVQALVEEISLSSFSKPFRHVATLNSRLRTTGGRYLLQSHNLEFNERVLQLYGMEEFVGVIKHELCHYHLHLEGKGYQHKDKDFKELLQKIGGARYVNDLRFDEERKSALVYQCKTCHQTFERKRKINTRKYVCGKCRGRLHLLVG